MSAPCPQSLSLHVIIMLALPSCVASPSMLTQLRMAYSSFARITALDVYLGNSIAKKHLTTTTPDKRTSKGRTQHEPRERQWS